MPNNWNENRYSILIFNLFLIGLFGFIIYAIKTSKEKIGLGRKFTIIISAIGTIFSSLYAASLIPGNENLSGLVILFAFTLLPILWFLMFAGLILYGAIAIITGKTLVGGNLPTQKVGGPEARYLGLIWVIGGLLMLLLEAWVITSLLCPNFHLACSLNKYIDNTFSSLGQLLDILTKPLQWTGLIQSR